MPVPSMEKRLDIAILGSPNAGKSVLLNTLIKEKLAACSHKKHTTRSQILGVFNHRNVQLVFYDTPGFVRSAEAVKHDTKALRDIAIDATTDIDIVLIVVDAAKQLGIKQQDAFAEMVKVALNAAKLEIILVLNKVDLVNPKVELLDTTRKLVSLINGVKLGKEKAHLAVLDTTTFMISATENDGVIDIKNYLISLAQPKSWLINKSQGFTDLTMGERVEEIVLEMLLKNTHEEIPYVCDVVCTSINDTRSSPNRRIFSPL